MKKKKIYTLIILLIFIFVLSVGLTCKEATSRLKKNVENVGEQTQNALNAIKRKPIEEENNKFTWGEERIVTWVEVEEKEETGSSQSEDVDNLEKYIEGSISLKGKVNFPIQGFIELNIDGETNTVEGSIRGVGWTMDVITGDEGDGSEDHHHTMKCEVIFNGTFFGTIDGNGKIFANVVGTINGKDGECKQLIKDKPESFTLTGDYSKDYNFAEGDLRPQRWMWRADKV
jgi:hypothetical protein